MHSICKCVPKKEGRVGVFVQYKTHCILASCNHEVVMVFIKHVDSIYLQILLCIQSIVSTDHAVECRRAAVMVVTSLLKGLESTALNVNICLFAVFILSSCIQVVVYIISCEMIVTKLK